MAYNRSEHPKLVGDISTAMIIARLIANGTTVLTPFGENQRYDLVIEQAGKFVRVQCKTGRLRGGVILFPACSRSYHHPNASTKRFNAHDYRGDADLFAVYCEDTDGVYLVPVGAVGRSAGTLRVAPTRNNQSSRVRFAKDFELPRRVGAPREVGESTLAYG